MTEPGDGRLHVAYGSLDLAAAQPCKVTIMALFAHRFITEIEPELPINGSYDEDLDLLVDDRGVPVAEIVAALATRADRDRPGVRVASGGTGTLVQMITKADRDRDIAGAEMITKPAGERVKDIVVGPSPWGPLPG